MLQNWPNKCTHKVFQIGPKQTYLDMRHFWEFCKHCKTRFSFPLTSLSAFTFQVCTFVWKTHCSYFRQQSNKSESTWNKNHWESKKMCGFFSTLILLVEKNFCSWEFFLKKRFEDSTRRVIGETTRNVPFLPLNCLLSNKPCPTNGGTSHFYLLSPFPSLDSLMENDDFSRIFILFTIIRFST